MAATGTTTTTTSISHRQLLTALAVLVALNCLFQELPSFQFHTPTHDYGRSLSVHKHKDENDFDDIHSPSIALLPLLEWEEQSLQGLYQASTLTSLAEQKEIAQQTCQPPPGIPPQCCLGTFAGGGRIIHNRRHQCARPETLQQFQQMQQPQQTAVADGCDVCQLVDYLAATNQTMAFVGDSMSHQIFQGFLCEFYRRNYSVQEHTERIPLQQRSKQQQQQQQQYNCNGLNHCISLIRTIHISSPLWPTNQTVSFQYMNIYRLPFGDPKQLQLVTTAADILVLNFGLHWGANHDTTSTTNAGGLTSPHNPPTPNHLQMEFTNLLTNIAQKGRVRKVLFRETSAQHFDAEGGDYSFVKPKSSRRISTQSTTPAIQSDVLYRPPLQCVPHSNGPTSGWRESVIRKAAQQANYSIVEAPLFHSDNNWNPKQQQQQRPTLTILPLFEYTKDLPHLHPYEERENKDHGGGGGDCTHYCSSPFLYMPLWKSIRQAIP